MRRRVDQGEEVGGGHWIVIVSAHIDNESHAALSKLADRIIRKPFRPVEIVETALELARST